MNENYRGIQMGDPIKINLYRPFETLRGFRRPLTANGLPINIQKRATLSARRFIPKIIDIPKPSGECRVKINSVVYDFNSYLKFTRKLYKNEGLTLQIIPRLNENRIEIREKINGHLMDTIKLKDARTPLDNEGNPIKIDHTDQSVSVLGSIIRKALPKTQGRAGIDGVRYCNFPKDSFIIKYPDRFEIRNIEDGRLLGTVRLGKKDHKVPLMQQLEELIERKKEDDPQAKKYTAMFVLDISEKNCRVLGVEDRKNFYHDDIARAARLSEKDHARKCINGLYVPEKGLSLYRPNFRKIEARIFPELFKRMAQSLIKEGVDPKMPVVIPTTVKGITSLEELVDQKAILEQEKHWYSIIAAIFGVLGDRFYGSFRKLAVGDISPINFIGKSFDFLANILKWLFKR